jgi:hypothetical protein
VGVGGALTGRGFKIGIVDDPFKNREEADSAVIARAGTSGSRVRSTLARKAPA